VLASRPSGCCFSVSVVALASAATLAIGGVLRPQTRLAIRTEQVQQFAAPPWVSADPVQIKGNMLASLAQSLEKERLLNDGKARLADRAACALLVGLLALAGQALVLGLHELM
jgi:hypothetical protein